MAATVFSSARYGLTKDTTATGLHLANLSFDYVTEQAEVRNHIGCEVGLAVYNDGADVSCDGVVESKTTGFVTDLAAVVVLANTSADSLDLMGQNMFSTPSANDGLILTGGNVARTNTGFETGSMTLRYRPLIATNSPSTLTD